MTVSQPGRLLELPKLPSMQKIMYFVPNGCRIHSGLAEMVCSVAFKAPLTAAGSQEFIALQSRFQRRSPRTVGPDSLARPSLRVTVQDFPFPLLSDVLSAFVSHDGLHDQTLLVDAKVESKVPVPVGIEVSSLSSFHGQHHDGRGCIADLVEDLE